MTNYSISPEIIKALASLRRTYLVPEIQAALDTLDNAGIFSAIDEATGYSVDGCTCPPSYTANDFHQNTCPRYTSARRVGKGFEFDKSQIQKAAH